MPGATIRLGLVGVGKIARDQHFPAIAGNDVFELAAVATRSGPVAGHRTFPTLEAMLDGAEIDAVILCTPPQVRHANAHLALSRGKHVFLEKPPGATLSEVEDLAALANEKGVTLLASWHSRYAPAVEAARSFLRHRTVRAARVTWKEDVRRWHPGQAWIWEPGGLGVFDPGINALSIVTRILPRPFFLTGGTLSFPSNRQAPIAADLAFTDAGEAKITAAFDWRQEGPQTWDIEVETDGGTLALIEGGSRMAIDGREASAEPEAEYPGLYARFAELIRDGESDVDLAPLRHVADAFMLGRRKEVEAFVEDPAEAAA